MVSIVTICMSNESKDKVTKYNLVFSSVKFASMIDVVYKSLETINRHLSSINSTRSTIDLTTKSVFRIIKSEIDYFRL